MKNTTIAHNNCKVHCNIMQIYHRFKIMDVSAIEKTYLWRSQEFQEGLISVSESMDGLSSTRIIGQQKAQRLPRQHGPVDRRDLVR